MAGTTAELEGVATLVATLKAAQAELEDLTDAQDDAADLIVSQARARAPKQTGRLAASLRSVKTKGRAVTGSDLIYAPPIHWGWRARNINPNRFLLEAAEDTESQWVAIYDKDVQQALDKVRGA